MEKSLLVLIFYCGVHVIIFLEFMNRRLRKEIKDVTSSLKYLENKYRATEDQLLGILAYVENAERPENDLILKAIIKVQKEVEDLAACIAVNEKEKKVRSEVSVTELFNGKSKKKKE